MYAILFFPKKCQARIGKYSRQNIYIGQSAYKMGGCPPVGEQKPIINSEQHFKRNNWSWHLLFLKNKKNNNLHIPCYLSFAPTIYFKNKQLSRSIKIITLQVAFTRQSFFVFFLHMLKIEYSFVCEDILTSKLTR